MTRPLKVFSISILVLVLLLSAQTRQVVGDDMAPSIQNGDFIILSPVQDVLPGEVVVLSDPLIPGRTIIRRVLAIGGQTVTVADGHLKVGKRRLRATAMGDMGPYLIAKETLWAKKPAIGASWLTQHRAEPVTHWKADAVEVPEGHLYLMADDRDRAMDSRWWGPVSIENIAGVARIRVGAAHTWRPSWEILSGSPPIGA